MLLLLYKKKYLCDRLKTPKMASGALLEGTKNLQLKLENQKTKTNKQTNK